MDNLRIRQEIIELFQERFPDYPTKVRKSEIGLEVVVFSVPSKKLDKVENFILDLDNIFCSGTNEAIVPIVWDCASTAKFYPEMIT